MGHFLEITDLDLSCGQGPRMPPLNLQVNEGEALVLIGEKGAGKSELLKAIAGLRDVRQGRIELRGRNITQDAQDRRRVAWVAAPDQLDPHVSVGENLSQVLRAMRLSACVVSRKVGEIAAALQIEWLLPLLPSYLTGRQRQLVTLARAFLREFDLYLLDDPLSHIDGIPCSRLSEPLRSARKRLGGTMVYVTHDQNEAMVLADRIAVMKGGSILQTGSPLDIYGMPQNRYVAELFACPKMNFIDGVLSDGIFRFKTFAVPMVGYKFAKNGRRQGLASLGVRPEFIVRGMPATQAPLRYDVPVLEVVRKGPLRFAQVMLGRQRLEVQLDELTDVAQGDKLKIGFDPAQAALFDNRTGARL